MANVDFPKEFGEIRGTLARNYRYDRNGRRVVVSRVEVRKYKSGKQGLYLVNKRERFSPLSEGEIAARAKFADVAAKVADLSEVERKAYAAEWKKARYCYRGKKYATLRGYIVARLHKDDPIRIDG